MRQLKFDDIIDSIKGSKNKYEEKHGIATLDIYLLDKEDNLAFFLADKSDNSKTLYFAVQPDTSEDHWVWCCPNREHIEFLTTDLKAYTEKNKISQDLDCKTKIVFNNIEEILNNIKTTLRDDYVVSVIKKGETTLLVAVSDTKIHLFIAIKPSIRFGHWYLFFPSKKQIQLIINDLGKKYVKIDSNNDLTRSNKKEVYNK